MKSKTQEPQELNKNNKKKKSKNNMGRAASKQKYILQRDFYEHAKVSWGFLSKKI